ncbi:hypothetical protein HDU84_006105 [Entophlyctis sp. JEL0112]|nr:hypothetical protein HDU84_006105 [Entophlyctis sp. JEL0112]
MYSKRHGHAEWVTCVQALHHQPPASADSALRVASGGMDAKICLWDIPATTLRDCLKYATCIDLLGHTGSISSLASLFSFGLLVSKKALQPDSTALAGNPGILLSSSYDSTVKLWDSADGLLIATLGQGKQDEPQELWLPSIGMRPHTPNGILGFMDTSAITKHAQAFSEQQHTFDPVVTTYTKAGIIFVHDVNAIATKTAAARGKPVSQNHQQQQMLVEPATTPINAHRGPISALVQAPGRLGADGRVVASAGLLDGTVRCFDLRISARRRCRGVARFESIHSRSRADGGGAGVTMMVGVGPHSLVTAGGGADGLLKVLDLRGGDRDAVAIDCRRGSASGKSTVSAMKPANVVYALKGVPQLHGVAVGWGDGTVQLVANACSGEPIVQTFNLSALGVRNAVRVIDVNDGENDAVNTKAETGTESETEAVAACTRRLQLTCAGDDGVAVLLGACSGFAAKKIAKGAGLTIGLGFMGLQALAYTGFVKVDWSKVESALVKKLDADGDGKPRCENYLSSSIADQS